MKSSYLRKDVRLATSACCDAAGPAEYDTASIVSAFVTNIEQDLGDVNSSLENSFHVLNNFLDRFGFYNPEVSSGQDKCTETVEPYTHKDKLLRILENLSNTARRLESASCTLDQIA